MKKDSLIIHFKAAATRLVAAIMLTSLLFLTVQPAQANSFTIPGKETWEVPQTLDGEEEGLNEKDSKLITDCVDANITNSGSIITTGADAHGIFSLGDNNTNITNNGSISTSGNSDDAIQIYFSDNATIINGGKIQVLEGEDKDGAHGYLLTHYINNVLKLYSGPSVF